MLHEPPGGTRSRPGHRVAGSLVHFMASRLVLVPAHVKEKSVSRFECHPGGGKGRIDVLAADGLGRVCPLGSPDRGNVNQDAPGEKPVTGEAGQVWSLRIVDRPAVV